MSFLPWHKHSWSPWEDNGEVTKYVMGHVGERAYQVAQTLEQIRECKVCHKKQKRHV